MWRSSDPVPGGVGLAGAPTPAGMSPDRADSVHQADHPLGDHIESGCEEVDRGHRRAILRQGTPAVSVAIDHGQLGVARLGGLSCSFPSSWGFMDGPVDRPSEKSSP